LARRNDVPESPRSSHKGRPRASHVVGDAVGDQGRVPASKGRTAEKKRKRKPVKLSLRQQLEAELMQGKSTPPPPPPTSPPPAKRKRRGKQPKSKGGRSNTSGRGGYG
jgi:hypothetical protein